MFAPFTQKLGVRFSKLTHKHGKRNSKSEEVRSQWQATRQFVQDQAFFDRLKGESICRSTSLLLALAISAALALADIGLFYLSKATFQREEILTKWK